MGRLFMECTIYSFTLKYLIPNINLHMFPYKKHNIVTKSIDLWCLVHKFCNVNTFAFHAFVNLTYQRLMGRKSRTCFRSRGVQSVESRRSAQIVSILISFELLKKVKQSKDLRQDSGTSPFFFLYSK